MEIKKIGQLVDFELINGQHYSIFTFTTLNGRTYDRIRNLPKESIIKETSLEDVYIDSGVEEFLHRQLPINDIPIKYVEDDPTDFRFFVK
ncbi:MAG: hypothetical protein PUB90_00525 [bacterium]|nr:hypothetical protein [bacterium]